MGVILQIPCNKEGKLCRAEITRSLDMRFLDYDLEYDIAFEAMGGDLSLCSRAYKFWQDDPLGFICASGFIPVPQLGVVSCGLVCKAIPVVEKFVESRGEPLECFKNALDLASICGKQFRQARREIVKVYHLKQDLTKAWNARMGIVRSSLGKIKMPAMGEEMLVDAALACSDMVGEFWEYIEQNEKWPGALSHPLIIARLVNRAIVSEASEVAKRHSEWFKGAALQTPSDLAEELNRMARMEAEWAVEILEGLS